MITYKLDTMNVDLQTRIVNALLDHWPLVVGMAIAAWWLLPKILPGVIMKTLPEAMKYSLNNGGGDIIRSIVREENEKQSKSHAEELDRRFIRHEEDEDERFREIEEELQMRRRPRRRSPK